MAICTYFFVDASLVFSISFSIKAIITSLSVVLLLLYACLNYAFTNQTLIVENDNLTSLNSWFFIKWKKKFDFSDISTINVVRNLEQDHLTDSQNLALTNFGKIELIFKNGSIEYLANGYSIFYLNLASQFFIDSISPSIKDKLKINKDLSSELSTKKDGNKQITHQKITFSTKKFINHFAIKSFFLSCFLIFFGSMILYLDHFPTQAMIRAGNDEPSFLLTLLYQIMLVSGVSFMMLSIYYLFDKR